ncbi:MAG TPA: hypothetical protein VHR43_02825 [Gemmatimonadales bacterium]|nr:hypothetical protein [Gemmatimonadales bacterium]
MTPAILRRSARPVVLAGILALAPGCSGAGRFLEELFRERPPAPLDSLPLASDARIDSAGTLAGSFVGEGTPRAIHLLSSDTVFIGGLLRRFRPDLSATDPWAALAAGGVVTLAPGGGRRTVAGSPVVASAVVGSPLGHTDVRVVAVVLHGGRPGCGARGAQAELIVADQRRAGDPPLRGPVLGSLRTGAAVSSGRGLIRRDSVAAPDAALIGELVGRTGRALDSSLVAGHAALRLQPDPAAELEINTLADVDAADVIAFRVSGDRVRYAVSLRTRRIAARGDTLVAAAVMVWDSAGAWRQDIFRPTLLRLRGGRLEPWGSRGRPIYWRRLQPISDFAFARDVLWLEQVDVRDGAVRWGIVQPTDNVVTAAAEVDGPCR